MNLTSLPVYRFVVQTKELGDPRSTGLCADAHALGLTQVKQIQCNDLYFIEGQLDEKQLHRLAFELLSDPVTQKVEWCKLGAFQRESNHATKPPDHWLKSPYVRVSPIRLRNRSYALRTSWD